MWPFTKNEPVVESRVEPVLNQSADSALVKSGDPRVLDLFGLGEFANGVAVNERTAMQISAVHGCVRVLTGAFSLLPLHLYKETSDGREKVSNHPMRRLLNLQPCPRFSASSWRKYLGKSNLLKGDGFSEIMRGRNNQVLGFLPHHPDFVIVERNGERLDYFVDDNGKRRGVQMEDMLHVPGLGFNGVRSESLIQHYARTSMKGALAADRHAAEFFEKGTMQKFALLSQKNMDDTVLEQFRRQWAETYGGYRNSHKPLVLTGGTEIKELTLSAADAQLLESRAFNVADIARFFGVPPHMIGHTENTTSWGSGIEQMSIAFVIYSLAPFLVDFSQEINRKLFPNEDYFFEFETKALLQGDSKAQAEFLRAALGGSSGPGWMTQDEARRIQNLKPKGGKYDELTQWQQGSVTISTGSNARATNNG
ncbi:MAG TPA: phage portal protein [Limnobacter sp.]|uniref:phage portal protein n=1 Tax=Limnobacter sp. TaxID=2003368 RepID=UPI002E305372|nr:phage portal protein [Limnobacter sp.]HEX5486507.1 phage portal protein [Limnobacter sp.]